LITKIANIHIIKPITKRSLNLEFLVNELVKKVNNEVLKRRKTKQVIFSIVSCSLYSLLSFGFRVDLKKKVAL
jgi:hypothetical protein